MMNRSLHLFFGLFFVCSFLVSTTLEAVGVDYHGYFRSRYHFLYNLDLERGISPNTRNYADLRFRLDPTFFITEKLRIKTSFNLLDAAAGGTNFRGMAHANPNRDTHPLLNNTQTTGVGARVGQSMTEDEMSSWAYGGVFAPDAAMETAGVGPIQLRRAWAEVETDMGILKVGRMPFHLGLGIFANQGDGLDQEIGTTRDRVLFESFFGSYYFKPSISWFYEGVLDQGGDDVFEFGFQVGRKSETQDLGMYFSYIGQAGAGGADNNGSLAGRETAFWVIDFYGKHQFQNVDLGGELIIFTGDYLGKDLLAFNGALQADWKASEKFNLLGEAGYSSGTSDGDVTSGDLKTISFNRDYNVAYLVFEEALPGGISRTGRAATTPHSGAVSNAMYARLKAKWKLAKWFHPSLNVITPFAVKKAQGAGGKFYGIEYDLITEWPIDEYVSAEFIFAHFIPGGFYEQVSAGDQATLVRAGLNVKF